MKGITPAKPNSLAGGGTSDQIACVGSAAAVDAELADAGGAAGDCVVVLLGSRCAAVLPTLTLRRMLFAAERS